MTCPGSWRTTTDDASHGILFENLHGIGGRDEGDPGSIQNLDGYDGSIRPDGDRVYASWPNHVEPLTIHFADPVSTVGSFVATGKEGDVNTLTVSAFDSDGNLLTSYQATVEAHDDPDNREGYWALQAEGNEIATVTIRNDNPTDYGNALIVDDLTFSRFGTEPAGDFNGDGLWDASDLDAMVLAIAAGAAGADYDLNGDGLVYVTDIDAWLAEAGSVNLGPGQAYLRGDGNLDGVVDVSDFNLWNAH